MKKDAGWMDGIYLTIPTAVTTKQGVARIRLEGLVAREPFYVARVQRLPDQGRLSDPAVKALAINLREATQELHRALRSRAASSSSSSSSSSRVGASQHLPSAREVAESIQNASPVTLADELVTHLAVALEGQMVGWLVGGLG